MRTLLISALLGLLPLTAFAQRHGGAYHFGSPFTPATVGPAGIPTSAVPGTALYGLPGTTVPPGTALYGLPALTAPRAPVYTRPGPGHGRGHGRGHGHGRGYGAVPLYGVS